MDNSKRTTPVNATLLTVCAYSGDMDSSSVPKIYTQIPQTYSKSPETPFKTPAIRLEGLSKQFGQKHAVQNINLSIPQGMLYGLLGPNGAGKTTTLRMIAGLLRPDAGEVLILGDSVTQNPEIAKQHLAYLPDDPMLYAKLRPLEYLEFVAGLWGIAAEQAAPKAEEFLKSLLLWENRFDMVETFSRGMKQKLALAGALIHQPKVLILDEPLTGLDVAAARHVKAMLHDFVAAGNTVIFTTHILEVAEKLCERLAIISSGMLVAEGTLAELQARAGDRDGSLEDVFLQLTGLEG